MLLADVTIQQNPGAVGKDPITYLPLESRLRQQRSALVGDVHRKSEQVVAFQYGDGEFQQAFQDKEGFPTLSKRPH